MSSTLRTTADCRSRCIKPMQAQCRILQPTAILVAAILLLVAEPAKAVVAEDCLELPSLSSSNQAVLELNTTGCYALPDVTTGNFLVAGALSISSKGNQWGATWDTQYSSGRIVLSSGAQLQLSNLQLRHVMLFPATSASTAYFLKPAILQVASGATVTITNTLLSLASCEVLMEYAANITGWTSTSATWETDGQSYFIVSSFTSPYPGGVTLQNVTFTCEPDTPAGLVTTFAASSGQDLVNALLACEALSTQPASIRLLRNITLAPLPGSPVVRPSRAIMLGANTLLDGGVHDYGPTVLDLRSTPQLVAVQPGAVLRLANLQLQGLCFLSQLLDPVRGLITVGSTQITAVASINNTQAVKATYLEMVNVTAVTSMQEVTSVTYWATLASTGVFDALMAPVQVADAQGLTTAGFARISSVTSLSFPTLTLTLSVDSYGRAGVQWITSSISSVPAIAVLALGFQQGTINCQTQRQLTTDMTQLNATMSPLYLAGTNTSLVSGLTTAALNTSTAGTAPVLGFYAPPVVMITSYVSLPSSVTQTWVMKADALITGPPRQRVSTAAGAGNSPAVVDCMQRTAAIAAPTRDQTFLYLQRLTLRNLPAQPLSSVTRVTWKGSGVEPSYALPLWTFGVDDRLSGPKVLLDSCSLELPAPEYLEVLAAARRGVAWQKGAIAAQSPLLQALVSFAPAAGPDLTSIPIVLLEGLGMRCTNCRLFPSTPVNESQVPVEYSPPPPRLPPRAPLPPPSPPLPIVIVAESDSSSSSKSQSIIGIAVGVGVGVPLVLLALGLAVWYRRRHARLAEQAELQKQLIKEQEQVINIYEHAAEQDAAFGFDPYDPEGGAGAGSLLYGEGSGGGFDVAEEGPEVVLVADDGQQFRARLLLDDGRPKRMSEPGFGFGFRAPLSRPGSRRVSAAGTGLQLVNAGGGGNLENIEERTTPGEDRISPSALDDMQHPFPHQGSMPLGAGGHAASPVPTFLPSLSFKQGRGETAPGHTRPQAGAMRFASRLDSHARPSHTGDLALAGYRVSSTNGLVNLSQVHAAPPSPRRWGRGSAEQDAMGTVSAAARSVGGASMRSRAPSPPNCTSSDAHHPAHELSEPAPLTPRAALLSPPVHWLGRTNEERGSGNGPQSPAGGTKAAAEVLRMHLFETRERLRRAISAARTSLSPSPTPYHGSGARTSRFGHPGAAASPVGTAGMLVVATEEDGQHGSGGDLGASQNGHSLLTPGWSPTFGATAGQESPVFSLTAQGLVPAASPVGVTRGRSGRSAALGFVSAPGSRRASLSDAPPSPPTISNAAQQHGHNSGGGSSDMGRSGISLAGVRRSLEEGERGAVSAPQVVLALQDREAAAAGASSLPGPAAPVAARSLGHPMLNASMRARSGRMSRLGGPQLSTAVSLANSPDGNRLPGTSLLIRGGSTAASLGGSQLPPRLSNSGAGPAPIPQPATRFSHLAAAAASMGRSSSPQLGALGAGITRRYSMGGSTTPERLRSSGLGRAVNSRASSSAAQHQQVRYSSAAATSGSASSGRLAALASALQAEASKLTVLGSVARGRLGSVLRAVFRNMDVAGRALVFDEGEAGEDRAVMVAAIATSVMHPNVVSTLHYDVVPLEDGALQGHSTTPDSPRWQLYLVQEVCTANLAHALSSNVLHDPNSRQPNMDLVLGVLLDIAAGLAYLHSTNIVHGDLRPENVLLKPDMGAPLGGVAKVVDFGLSTGTDTSLAESCTPFVAQTTKFYQAPEVVMGGSQVTPSSDVYAFGVLMWELYTGLTPWQKSAKDVAGYQLSSSFRTFGSDAPNGYAQLAKDCMDYVPGTRPTMEEVLEDLAVLMEEYMPILDASGGSTPFSSAAADERAAPLTRYFRALMELPAAVRFECAYDHEAVSRRGGGPVGDGSTGPGGVAIPARPFRRISHASGASSVVSGRLDRRGSHTSGASFLLGAGGGPGSGLPGQRLAGAPRVSNPGSFSGNLSIGGGLGVGGGAGGVAAGGAPGAGAVGTGGGLDPGSAGAAGSGGPCTLPPRGPSPPTLRPPGGVPPVRPGSVSPLRAHGSPFVAAGGAPALPPSLVAAATAGPSQPQPSLTDRAAAPAAAPPPSPAASLLNRNASLVSSVTLMPPTPLAAAGDLPDLMGSSRGASMEGGGGASVNGFCMSSDLPHGGLTLDPGAGIAASQQAGQGLLPDAGASITFPGAGVGAAHRKQEER